MYSSAVPSFSAVALFSAASFQNSHFYSVCKVTQCRNGRVYLILIYFEQNFQKLCIDPSLPSDEEFNGMFVNRNGSRVALSSAHSVFVIEMPNDIWCRRAVTVNPLTEHLQSAYHCRLHFFHFTSSLLFLFLLLCK